MKKLAFTLAVNNHVEISASIYTADVKRELAKAPSTVKLNSGYLGNPVGVQTVQTVGIDLGSEGPERITLAEQDFFLGVTNPLIRIAECHTMSRKD